MPECRERALVGAPLETVWAVLIDKAEHPHRYIEGVLDARVLERGDGWLRRELELPGAVFLEERVEVDEARHQVRFTLERHPDYRGHVVNHLRATTDPALCELDFEMCWEAVSESPDEGAAMDLVKCAIQRTRAISEEVARLG